MEYDKNYDFAVSLLIEQYGELFNTFPKEAKDGLITRERQILNSQWEQDNLRKAEERSKKAREMAKQMKSKMQIERLGQSSMGAYKRYKSVSISMEESCEYKHVEPNPTIVDGAKIRGFRKETILGMKHRIINAIRESESYQNITRTPVSYMYFKMYNNGKICGSTRTISVYEDTFEEDVEALFIAYDNIVKHINDTVYGYESLFSQDANVYTVFYMTALYFPSPRSVLFWGKNIPKIINCGIFKIFSANDTNKDCIEQCSQYLWNNQVFYTLDEIIEYANGNVCILTPQFYIRNIKEIKSYSDIRVHTDSPIKTLNVIDPSVKYLLQFKEHIGVLFDFKQQKRDNKITRFKPLTKFPKTEKITVCFDIEAYFDPDSENEQTHIPYLCCACFVYNDVIGNVIEFEGRDCVAQMIEYIVDICSELKNKNIELIAHNGGAYDFHYILSSMYNPSDIKNILIRNNNFISFSFVHDDITFNIKDSYSFLLCSLANAAKAFLTGNHDFGKTDFPHHDVRSKADLEKVYRKWRSIDNIIDIEIEKEKLLISSHNIINYETDGKSKKLLDWSREYCCNDVIVLAKVWLEFKVAVYEIFNSKVVDQSYTLAGMSFKLFESNLDPNIDLRHPKKEDYMNMKDSLIGGRCISVNGIYENILCLDVKSLYPAAMAFYDQPYGQFRRVQQRMTEELGIYYVRVIPHTKINSNFFPVRYNNKITYNNYGSTQYNAWYTSVDIDIGISEGHDIQYIPFDEEGNIGYSWINKGKIFQKYIEDTLYKLKLKYEEEGNKVKRNVIKIIMNSLWGKFAQKWIDTNYSIKAESDVDFDEEEAYKIWDTEYMLIKQHKESEYSSKPIQNGVFTLSWARHHMKLLWDASTRPDTECIYSDTDSIFVRKEEFNLNSVFELNNQKIPVIGTDVGQLELECEFDKLLCAGKKQYMGFYKYLDAQENPQIGEKKRFKGVPAAYIKPELYTHLLKSPDKMAQVKFLKFRREWGSVKGYIESKNIRAT